MFVLSEEVPVQVLSSDGSRAKPDAVKWLMMQHTQPQQLAMVVWAGHKCSSPEITVDQNDGLHLKVVSAPPKPGLNDLELVVRFRSAAQAVVLVREIIPAHRAPGRLHQVDVPMSEVAGQTGALEIECVAPGILARSSANWLALTECLVCSPEKTSLARARMHNDRRRETEIKHFANTYKMPMFQPKAKPNAFSVAQQIIQGSVLTDSLNFALRLRAMAKVRPLRVASLCCGAGRMERMLVNGIEDKISISLIDINQGLLDQASALLSDVSQVDTICADANVLDLPSGEYDVVLCVSALHHIIELESLVDSIAGSLKNGGEFWSIAEYVGRTGARLWQESYEAADAIFSDLPARYRENHAAGGKVTDDHLRNVDCSLNSFEGVRSDDILPILESRLEAHRVDRWSTIGWRVLGPAYVPNYDVENIMDRALVEYIAHRDVEFQAQGILRPVAMKGVFRRR